MKKRTTIPSTSRSAHESVKEHKSVMYDKITTGLMRLKVGGTFEEIAKAAGLKPDQTWKRISEMIEMGKVYNVGVTRPTSSGRKAMVRQLVELNNNNRTVSKQLNLL